MTSAQITLTPTQSAALAAVSRSQGKTPDEILCEAVEVFLVKHHHTSSKTECRLSKLKKGRGIWKDRDDLPALEKLRKEWQRPQGADRLLIDTDDIFIPEP